MSNQMTVRNSFKGKLESMFEILSTYGFSGLIQRLSEYTRYHLKDKWRFVYFELNLAETPYTLPKIDEALIIRRATHEDIQKIKNDIYPFMTFKQEFDKPYIERIGDEGIECFIAEKKRKIIHYFMVFNNAIESPLVQTPFDESKILDSDIYLGNAFTIPDERGMWVVPHVLLSIVSYFQSNTTAKRVLLLVHEDTPGAIGFFQRLGFSILSPK